MLKSLRQIRMIHLKRLTYIFLLLLPLAFSQRCPAQPNRRHASRHRTLGLSCSICASPIDRYLPNRPQPQNARVARRIDQVT